MITANRFTIPSPTPSSSANADLIVQIGFRIKGKNASSTENRRFSWEVIIWPLVLELERPFFTLKEYRAKRNYISTRYGITVARARCGFVSLINRGFIIKNDSAYSLNYKFHRHLNRKEALSYAMAANSILRTHSKV